MAREAEQKPLSLKETTDKALAYIKLKIDYADNGDLKVYYDNEEPIIIEKKDIFEDSAVSTTNISEKSKTEQIIITALRKNAADTNGSLHIFHKEQELGFSYTTFIAMGKDNLKELTKSFLGQEIDSKEFDEEYKKAICRKISEVAAVSNYSKGGRGIKNYSNFRNDIDYMSNINHINKFLKESELGFSFDEIKEPLLEQLINDKAYDAIETLKKNLPINDLYKKILDKKEIKDQEYGFIKNNVPIEDIKSSYKKFKQEEYLKIHNDTDITSKCISSNRYEIL